MLFSNVFYIYINYPGAHGTIFKASNTLKPLVGQWTNRNTGGKNNPTVQIWATNWATNPRNSGAALEQFMGY